MTAVLLSDYGILGATLAMLELGKKWHVHIYSKHKFMRKLGDDGPDRQKAGGGRMYQVPVWGSPVRFSSAIDRLTDPLSLVLFAFRVFAPPNPPPPVLFSRRRSTSRRLWNPRSYLLPCLVVPEALNR